MMFSGNFQNVRTMIFSECYVIFSEHFFLF